MEALLIYWLKANVVLALFAAAYHALLRRLTFFGLNRAFLLLALGFAAVYPLLPVPALLPPVATPVLLAVSVGPAGMAASTTVVPGFDWWWLAGAGYLAGAAGLLLRLLGQLLSLARLRRRTRPAVVLGQAVRIVPGAGSPFSFGGTIYLTESALHDPNLALALRHEQAHVRQGHTLDVLLLQAATALAWANPAAWLLRRYALDNLEYLADEAALRGTTLPRRDYQYLLLRQQAGAVPAPALAFHFSLSTLKNRILMLNQPLSASRQRGRYLLAALLAAGLALGYSGARAQTGPQPAPTTKPLPDNTVIYLDGRQVGKAELDRLAPSDMISYINVLKPAQAQQIFQVAAPTMLVYTKASASSPEVLAFNKRVSEVAPLVPATPSQNASIAAVQAYMKQHYPTVQVEAVGMVPGKDNRYQATYQENGKRWQLFFDGEGNVVPR